MERGRLSRRELLGAGVAASGALALGRGAAAAAGSWTRSLDFTRLAAGGGWPGWRCVGVANLHRDGGRGLLEAGSDVFPSDPRPVAFAVDQRFRDGTVAARLLAGGAGAGVVVRRTGPRDYYAAVVDAEQGALIVVRRSAAGVSELARAPLPLPGGPLTLSLRATGARPAVLTATVERGGATTTVTAHDAAPALQRAGDPGVLATARTLIPSQGPAVLPALGNLHVLAYGVQGFGVVTGGLLPAIRERSTAVFASIVVEAAGTPGPTLPSVVAATTGAPIAGGAHVRVATDVRCRVDIEVAPNPGLRNSRRVRVRRTDTFDSAIARVGKLKHGRRVYWRARMMRHGRVSVGPVRSFRVLPKAGSPEPATIAIGSCASQFGPLFDHLTAAEPDAFVWQGDLNYPDTAGPLAQTSSGYAGLWRDFLANPKLAALFERSAFAAQRDDHDYGVQDANSGNLVPWGLHPWESLVERRDYYRFTAGAAEFWVLDQRRHKTAPGAPDTAAKTLLGREQREWLLRTLAASRAAFKVICSPCTIAPLSANVRDGSWATGFTAERDLLLRHVRERVRGRVLFVTGDTHWSMVYERGGLFEARPCPLGIPTPNDITLVDPFAAATARRTPGVLYADDTRGHFALIDVGGGRLRLRMVREDGRTVFERSFVA